MRLSTMVKNARTEIASLGVDDFLGGSLSFSRDSKRTAYNAMANFQQFVVVDEKEGRQYDVLVKGGRIIFESPDSLRSIAIKGNGIYLVEERIK